MTITQLLQQLEQYLGYHQLPWNPKAKRIEEIFDSSPVHTTLMTRIVRAIYKANRCQNMNDNIDLAPTNEAIAEIRLEILHSPTTDVDVYSMIEDLCHAIDAIFSGSSDTQNEIQSQVAPAQGRGSARIIGLDHYRRLKSQA